jgi:Holliday junction resolvase
MKALVDYYKSFDYEKITYNDYYYGFLRYNHMKYSEAYDSKYERVLIDYKFPHPNNIYDSFETEMRKDIPNYDKEGVFWRWAERDAFLKEKDYIKSKTVYDTNKIVRWVSRFNGDGYGYDVLSYDPDTKREKLIEVKAPTGKKIFITNEEVRKAYETSKSNYCDYYVYIYFSQKDAKPKVVKLKFDKEKYYFVNIDNPEDIYYISGTLFNTKDYNSNVQLYLETKEEFDYLKNRDIPVQKI